MKIKDAFGGDWELKPFTVGTFRRLKEYFGDLFDPAEFFARVLRYEFCVDLIYRLNESEATARGIGDELAFADRWFGDALEVLQDSLREAYVDFFPSRVAEILRASLTLANASEVGERDSSTNTPEFAG